jgi:hypothetical protein
MAVLLVVLKYPTYNLAPETGAWIIGDSESAVLRQKSVGSNIRGRQNTIE